MEATSHIKYEIKWVRWGAMPNVVKGDLERLTSFPISGYFRTIKSHKVEK